MSTTSGADPQPETEPGSGTDGLLAACKSAAKAVLIAPVSALGRVGVLRAEQWSDVRKQVVSSVLVALLLGGIPAVYSSWDRLFPEGPPPAFAGDKIGILVAQLEGDSGGTYQTNVLRSLQRMFTAGDDAQAELRRYPRALTVGRGNEIFAGEREATVRGREWLKQQNADFLVWGEIAGPNVLRLRILARAANTNPLQMTPYRLSDDSFLLPTTFSEDFGKLLNAFAEALSAPSFEDGDDARLLVVLKPVEARLRALFSNSPQAIKASDRAEIGLSLAAVSHAIALRTKDRARMREVVALYESLEPVVAASNDNAIAARYMLRFGTFLFRQGSLFVDLAVLKRSLSMLDKSLSYYTLEKFPTEWRHARVTLCLGNLYVATADRNAAAFDRQLGECNSFFREPAVLKLMYEDAAPAQATVDVETLICGIEMRHAGAFASADLFGRALKDCRAGEQRILAQNGGVPPVFYLTSLAEYVFELYGVHGDDALVIKTASELRDLHKKIDPAAPAYLVNYATDVACLGRVIEATVQDVVLPTDTIKAACDASLRRPSVSDYAAPLQVTRRSLYAEVRDGLLWNWPQVRDARRIDLARDYLAVANAAYADVAGWATFARIEECIYAVQRARMDRTDMPQIGTCADALGRFSSAAVIKAYVHYFGAYAARLSGDHDMLVKEQAAYDAVLAEMNAHSPKAQTRFFTVMGADIGTMLAEVDAKPKQN